VEDAGLYIGVGAIVVGGIAGILLKIRASLPTVDAIGMSRREYLAGVVAVLLGAPLVYMFAAAIADGQVRVKEAPFRAIVGAAAYDAVVAGDSDTHYVGNDRRAPDFTVADRAGRAWRLSDHRGKVVVMNFWTKTCRPCLEEMPSLLDLATRLEGRDDVELVAITTDPDWESIRTIFPPESQLEILFDPESEVVRDTFGTRLFPETWFIDPDGIIRLRKDGPFDWSSPVVEELIAAISG
jgi:peroxiredoxin